MWYPILIRITGALLLTSGCWIAGGQLENSLKYRRNFFRDAIALLRYMEKEMLQRRVALAEALLEASILFEYPWKQILIELSDKVIQYSGNTFSELWDETLRKYLKKDDLKAEEWQILARMALVFGGTDAEIQQTLLMSSLDQLSELEHRAAEEYRIRGKLYRRLSVMAAAFLVLILL